MSFVATYFETCTDTPAIAVAEIMQGHPKEAKMALAEEIVRMYHGADAAQKARADFDSTFSKRGSAPLIYRPCRLPGVPLMDALVSAGIVESKERLSPGSRKRTPLRRSLMTRQAKFLRSASTAL